MLVPRRDFLRLLGVAAGTAGLGGCGRMWTVPDDLVDRALRGPGLESEAQTVCGLCESGCGMTVRTVDGMPVGLKGNPHHPLNRGGLCPVGNGGLELLYAPDRLQGPLRREPEGELAGTTWDDALDQIGARLSELRAGGEGRRVALLHGEPGFLFDDLATRFVAALGSANSARPGDPAALAYALAQGTHEPGFDLTEADLVLSFGLDLYEDGPTPLHAISALVGARPTEDRAATIHIGTRLSPSAAKAERWVPVEPGTHAAFALGVAHVLVREGHYDRDFVARRTSGFEDWTDERGQRHPGFRRLLMERYYPDRAAQFCGANAATIVSVARRFAESPAPVAVAGGEASQGSNATWTVMAVHALNALMGSFDRAGGVTLAPPIPVTPLPGLPGASTEGSIFTPSDLRALAGIDHVEALAEGVLDGSSPIEVLFIASYDPVHDSPAGERLGEALQRIPTVVALAPFFDQTCRYADWVLPTSIFLERWQGTTTPTGVAFSTVGVARPVVEALYDTRHPGDVLLDLARRAAGDGDAVPWESYADYLRQRLEGLAVSRQGAIITGSFEESWVHFLEERGWRFAERRRPDDHWDELVRQAGWWNPVRPPEDWDRLFGTASGRYEFWSRGLEQLLRERGATSHGGSIDDDDALARGIDALGLEADPETVCFPHFQPPRTAGDGDVTLHTFRPITSRGSLAANSPMVLEMFGHSVLTGWQTWAELSPETAEQLGVGDGDLVAVESDRGSVEALVHVYPGSVPGVVHVPIGLGLDAPGRDGVAVGSNPLRALLAVHDPITGSLSHTSTRARLRVLERRSRGGPAPGHGRSP